MGHSLNVAEDMLVVIFDQLRLGNVGLRAWRAPYWGRLPRYLQRLVCGWVGKLWVHSVTERGRQEQLWPFVLAAVLNKLPTS